MNKKELDEILRKHKMWLNNEKGGERADFSWTDLSWVDLSCADLTSAIMIGTNLNRSIMRGINLRGAIMSDAIMRGTNLSESIMIGTNLSKAIMIGTDLRGVNMRGANLSGANLSGANLSGTNLKDVVFNEYTCFFDLVCPEEGPFIGFKRCGAYIVKLLILEDAKRSSATSRKCRCNKAKVLSITSLDGSKAYINKIESDYDKNFIYEVGKTVFVEDFDDDRWNECSTGIHFFITREEAVNY